MRTIIVSNIVSLDGFYEGPTQGVMDLPMDAAFDTYNLERITAADAVLLGATSYLGFNGYWPSIKDHPPVPDDDPAARQYDDLNRGISRRYDEVDIVVVSDRLKLDADAPWAARTRVIGRHEVAPFKESGDGECVVFGSRTMWNGLLADGLLDELHLMVGPTALVSGVPLFTAPTRLTLEGTRTFPGSDNVLLRYLPAT
jgi:dihydrofolate reductase